MIYYKCNINTDGAAMMNEHELSRELRKKYTRIAYYYYREGMTQQEIADRMGMSRQQINRILDACLKLGIVKISVELGGEFTEIEAALEKKYALRAVRIADAPELTDVNAALGAAAGEYLRGVIKNGDTIGVVPGRAIASLADAIGPVNRENLTVTQLMGSETMLEPKKDADSIIRRFSSRLNAAASPLYAPAMVSSRETRDSILQEPYFNAAYRTMRECSIAVVGIGKAHGARDYLSGEHVLHDTPAEAVGEVCTFYYDASGRPVEMPFSQRVIAIRQEDFLHIPERIGVAGGKEKAEAIRGALMGGYVNTLVTDLAAAHELMK